MNKDWKIKESLLEVSLSFSNGCFIIDSIYNIEQKVNYINENLNEPLFSFNINGKQIYANDGKWNLNYDSKQAIKKFDQIWGYELLINLSHKYFSQIEFILHFEIYTSVSGFKFYQTINNSGNKTYVITDSTIIALPLIRTEKSTSHFVKGRLEWSKTSAGIAYAKRNCIHVSNEGGWSIILENNWATSLKEGSRAGDENHPFMFLQAWHQNSSVQVFSDSNAINLTIFPEEVIDYFSINFCVFTGDIYDGKMAVAQYLRKRYKFCNFNRVLSINDWQWAELFPPNYNKKCEKYYLEKIIPKVKNAGIDNIHFDYGWNEHDDSAAPHIQFSNDIMRFINQIHISGIQVGFWFSLNGENWALGRDIADKENIHFKTLQNDQILVGKYHSKWQQIDFGLLWKTNKQTSYSTPMDSVYRKTLNLREYMNDAVIKNPDMMIQTTCEIDNPGGQQGVGLIHLCDNGLIGTYLRTESKNNVKDMFSAFGSFPLESMLETWGEGGQNNAWQSSAAWYYQFLLGKHTSIYSSPDTWDEKGIELLAKFNSWRKKEPIRTLLEYPVRPIYQSKRDDPREVFVAAEDEGDGPFVWLFMNEEQSQCLIIAVDAMDTKIEHLHCSVKWLNKDFKYKIQDITLKNDGYFNDEIIGEFECSQLRNGFEIFLPSYSSRARALLLTKI